MIIIIATTATCIEFWVFRLCFPDGLTLCFGVNPEGEKLKGLLAAMAWQSSYWLAIPLINNNQLCNNNNTTLHAPYKNIQTDIGVYTFNTWSYKIVCAEISEWTKEIYVHACLLLEKLFSVEEKLMILISWFQSNIGFLSFTLSCQVIYK